MTKETNNYFKIDMKVDGKKHLADLSAAYAFRKSLI